MESHIKEIIDKTTKHIPNWYNSNSNYDPLPMLAHSIKKVKKINFPVFGQPKLNGVRCLSKLTIDREYSVPSGPIKLISRGGTYYQVPHIQKQLMGLFSLLICNGFSEDLMLDGELYKHGVPLQEISGASRKEEFGLFTSNSWLEYHIYDVVDLSKPNQTQDERQNLLISIMLECHNKFPNIKFVNTVLIAIEHEIKTQHDRFVKEGYEGLILRDLLSSYKFNERSYGLLKVKEFIDEEFEIIGYEIDENKTIEESFVFVLKNNQSKMITFGSDSSHTFKARPTGSNAMKMRWFEEMLSKKHIGKKATVRYFERSKEGVPTMGTLRHDKCEFLHIRPNGE